MIELYYPCGITAEEYTKWWKNQMQKLNDGLDELDKISIEEFLINSNVEEELISEQPNNRNESCIDIMRKLQYEYNLTWIRLELAKLKTYETKINLI